jgi:tRNA threonylcarbamoyladenosine biosynthesis protein TsaB
VETSGRATGVAVLDCATGAVLAEHVQAARTPGAGQPLVPLVERALAEAGAGELALLACTIGPGSFTGLRVGLATLRGIGLVRGVPLAGVSTLRALAASAPAAAGAGGAIVPLVDAKKGEVYGAAFGGAGEVLVAEGAYAPAAFAERLRGLAAGARAGAELLLCGDGAPLVLAHLGGTAGVRDLGEGARAISPAAVGRLGLAGAARGEARAAGDVQPEYHRLSEAEVALRKRGGAA